MSDDDEGHGKRKADEGVEGESSRRHKAVNNNDLQIDPYANARQVFVDAVKVPAKFMCALSETIMADPVNLSTGQTVDRSAFEELFDVMPDDLIDQVTGIENLSSAIITPNVELQTCIETWLDSKLKAELRFQLIMMSYSQEYQLASARELRLMVKDFPSYANAFADLGHSAVLELVRPLLGDNLLSTRRSMHEDILVTAAQLSEYCPEIREHLVQHEIVIYIILESLRRGNPEARLSAMTLVYHITAVPSCRGALVRAGVIEHLSDLLKIDIMLVRKHAVSALCELCNESKYRRHVIRVGVIHSISDFLLDVVGCTDIYSRLLHQLSLDKVGLQQLAWSDRIHHWLLKSTRNTRSSQVMEHCLVTLSRILPVSEALAATFKGKMKYRLITRVIQTGTPVSKQAGKSHPQIT